MVGQAIAARLDELGHDVTIGTRDPEATLARTEADGMGNPPFAAWAEEHPAIGWPRSPTLPATRSWSSTPPTARVVARGAGLAGADNLAGKVLVDIANPLDFSQGMPPTLFVKDTDSLGEQIQRAFPRARVVKTLNTHERPPDGATRQLAERRPPVFVSATTTSPRTVTELLNEHRAHRRHRPGRHQHGARHRDAAAGVAAPVGRARDPDVQLQDRPLTDDHLSGAADDAGGRCW